MMTVTEASAVNTLLNYLLDQSTAAGDLVDPAQARDAVQTLASSAHSRLHAGLDATTAAIAWDNATPRPRRAFRVD
jgi:hypothetical protein